MDLLDFCDTDEQREIVLRLQRGETQVDIAANLNISRDRVYRQLTKIRGLAFQDIRNEAEDFELNKLPISQRLAGVTTQYKIVDGKEIPIGKYVLGRRDAQRNEAILEGIEAAAENITPRKAIPAPKKAKNDLCNMLHVTDYHLAMYADKAETGADWNINIARDEFIRGITELINAAPDADTGIFSQGGDFLHYDSKRAETPQSRHLLDADTRAHRMIELALDMHIFAIEQMLEKHRKVIVIIQEGNHDEVSSIWLRKMCKKYFAKNKRVDILDIEFPFYAYLHGDIMLAFHHGHKVKNKSLPALFASEPRYREMWGQARYCYIHTGHFHQREQDQSEYGGAVVERHPTLAARDAYAATGGYVSWRAMNLITYHSQDGEVSRRTTVPRQS